jgi:hypothetical protein
MCGAPYRTAVFHGLRALTFVGRNMTLIVPCVRASGTPDARPNTPSAPGQSFASARTQDRASTASHGRWASLLDTTETPESPRTARTLVPFGPESPAAGGPNAHVSDTSPMSEGICKAQWPEPEHSPCFRIPGVLNFDSSPSEPGCSDMVLNPEPAGSSGPADTDDTRTSDDVHLGLVRSKRSRSASCDFGTLGGGATPATAGAIVPATSPGSLARSARTPPMSPFLKIQVPRSESLPTSSSRKAALNEIARNPSGRPDIRPLRRTLSFAARAKGLNSPELRQTLSTPPANSVPSKNPVVDETLWSDVTTPDATAPHRPFITSITPQAIASRGASAHAYFGQSGRGSGLSLTESVRADCLLAAISPLTPDAPTAHGKPREERWDGLTDIACPALGHSCVSGAGCTIGRYDMGGKSLGTPTAVWELRLADGSDEAASPVAEEWRCAANTFLSLRSRTPGSSGSGSFASNSSGRSGGGRGQTRFADLQRIVLDLADRARPGEPHASVELECRAVFAWA